MILARPHSGGGLLLFNPQGVFVPMSSQPLLAPLLAAVLLGTPAQVSAFEAMDCIGTETCDLGVCTPSTLIFAIEFDWANEALGIAWGDGGVLPMTLETLDAEVDAPSGEVLYDGPDDTGLRLRFLGDEVTMDFHPGVAGLVHLAECAAREAA